MDEISNTSGHGAELSTSPDIVSFYPWHCYDLKHIAWKIA